MLALLQAQRVPIRGDGYCGLNVAIMKINGKDYYDGEPRGPDGVATSEVIAQQERRW